MFTWFHRKDRGVFRRLPLGAGIHLYLSPMPFGAYDPGNRVFKMYRLSGIRHVVMLLKEEEIQKKARRDIRNLYRKNDIEFSQFALKDLTAPALETLDDIVAFVVELLKTKRVAVHCHAGTGRTVVVACCVAQALLGLSAQDSIAFIRKEVEVVLVDEQERLISKWAASSKFMASRKPAPLLKAT